MYLLGILLGYISIAIKYPSKTFINQEFEFLKVYLLGCILYRGLNITKKYIYS